MAQIGYGYGSEYQMLRFLGHHRRLLESEILKAIGSDDQAFYWYDFDFADREMVISGDREMIGLSFLRKSGLIAEKKLKTVLDIVRSYKWNFEQWQNWDAVFINNGTIYFVEAKAHKDEISSGDKLHGGSNTVAIQEFMFEQFGKLVTEKWVRKYYQLANRLSTVKLLNDNGIPAKILNIFFINGYYDRNHQVCKDTSLETFREEIAIEDKELGISGVKEKYVVEVFVDANPN